MFTARNKGRLLLSGAVAVGAVLASSGCASSNPLDSGGGDGSSDATEIVVGSQAYYSNEIIAEIYAQALENAGYTVERQFQIGQRDAYLPELESGSVTLIPEYTGNLLQFYDNQTEATASDEVYDELTEAVPDGLTVLDQAEAADGDSYNVTTEFSEENDVTSLADLAGLDVPLTVGGNPELESRPYGPAGLQDVYGVDVSFVSIGDSGGPLTKDAIRSGQVTFGDIYTADPDLASGDFVTLEDPESIFLANNVVPLVNAEVADEIGDVINEVQAALDTEGLIALNAESVNDQRSSDQIATDWLEENGLLD
jgi:osmoprotectant transport system substrate-binding protein